MEANDYPMENHALYGENLSVKPKWLGYLVHDGSRPQTLEEAYWVRSGMAPRDGAVREIYCCTRKISARPLLDLFEILCRVDYEVLKYMLYL